MVNRARDLPRLPPIEDPHELDPWQCRKLWVAALIVKINIAFGGPDPSLGQSKANERAAERRRMREWLGSRAFHAECALAGLDGELVLWGLSRPGFDPQELTRVSVHSMGRPGPKVAA
ncbi:hypothetical protein [Marinovum algicola]|uniref:hypothetical protein n=1 Tax=Marinovum algicola TaxID=42444 RepID=UPI003B51E9D7